jgi:hypothetical protein
MMQKQNNEEIKNDKPYGLWTQYTHITAKNSIVFKSATIPTYNLLIILY